MHSEQNPRNMRGYEHNQYMFRPHRFKRRHIQFQKVISQLETIMFSKRQIRKIYRDQNTLNQFRMKKNLTQQLNYDLQELIKSMQTGGDVGIVEKHVNVNNLVSNCIKMRNDELKKINNNEKSIKEGLSPTMMTGITTLKELE